MTGRSTSRSSSTSSSSGSRSSTSSSRSLSSSSSSGSSSSSTSGSSSGSGTSFRSSAISTFPGLIFRRGSISASTEILVIARDPWVPTALRVRGDRGVLGDRGVGGFALELRPWELRRTPAGGAAGPGDLWCHLHLTGNDAEPMVGRSLLGPAGLPPPFTASPPWFRRV